ncbi:MAG: helix-turn-helix transcriptional regulator [bacterium]|nr:helix-turn-helix transcriptional regulator [bacterium]
MYRTQRCWALLGALGSHVREARRQRSLDQYGLADALGVHPATISRIESGKHWPGAALFERIAGYLGVEPPELFQLPKQSRLPVRDAFVKERTEVKANGFRLEMRRLDASLTQIDTPAAQACAVVIAGRLATIHPGGRETLQSGEVLFFTPGAEPVYAHALDQRGAAVLIVNYGTGEAITAAASR